MLSKVDNQLENQTFLGESFNIGEFLHMLSKDANQLENLTFLGESFNIFY